MLRIGDWFDRYRIDATLGRGGMGMVYRAFDTRLERSVALKVISADNTTADAKPRLIREARAAASLNHPHAVAIYDIGEVGGSPYIAMELLDGRTLRTYLRDRSVPVVVHVRWIAEIARALAAAHAVRLVHRDVKPDNVMVTAGGSVKVLDFGLAKRAASYGKSTLVMPGPASAYATIPGDVHGTPRYMAPEQMTGAELDVRSDQFSWGTLAYEVLTGMHPFPDSAFAGAAAIYRAPPRVSQVEPRVPEHVSDAVMRALSAERNDRFANMDDVISALEQPVHSVPEPSGAMRTPTALVVDEPYDPPVLPMSGPSGRALPALATGALYVISLLVVVSAISFMARPSSGPKGASGPIRASTATSAANATNAIPPPETTPLPPPTATAAWTTVPPEPKPPPTADSPAIPVADLPLAQPAAQAGAPPPSRPQTSAAAAVVPPPKPAASKPPPVKPGAIDFGY